MEGDPFDPKRLDLVELVRGLSEDVRAPTTEGYVMGRTRIRDAVAARLNCSQLRSEQLVDTLVAERFLRFVEDPAGSDPGYWIFDAEPDVPWP
jgi:hypothetical protein